MADPFVAEIRMFGFNFPPTGWAYCAGQLMPISQNTALFALLGTYYGGDGKATFALPNLIDKVGVHAGYDPSPSTTQRSLGEEGGVDVVTLLLSEIPVHAHNMSATTANGTTTSPVGAQLATVSSGGTKVSRTTGRVYSGSGSTLTSMNPLAVGVAGGSLPHNNLMPYTAINFCIALQGVFPQRWTASPPTPVSPTRVRKAKTKTRRGA